MPDRYALPLLVSIIFLAFALRVLSLDAQSMWRDEIDTLCFALDFWETLERSASSTAVEALPAAADHPSCQPTPGLPRIDPSRGLWPTLRDMLTLSGWNGPLYTVAMRPWIGLTGHSPFALRFSALFFGLLAVPLTYVLGRRLLGATVGLVGAALVAFSPHLVWYSQEAKMYGVILALALLAIYGLRRALDQTSKVSKDFGSLGWWGVMIVATTLAVYCHILAALLVPLHILLCLVWWPRARRHWRGALFSLACLTLPYLPLLAWQAHLWRRPQGQATLFAPHGLDVIIERTFNGWGVNGWGGYLFKTSGSAFVGRAVSIEVSWTAAALFALGGLALGGLMRARLTGERGRWRESWALLVWVLLPLVGVWLISLRQPIFTNRYLIWTAPGFYLLGASGAVALTSRGRGGALIAGGLLSIILVGDGLALRHQATQPLKPDFRAAAAYVGERYQPGDLVIFHLSYMQHNFDFYFERDYDGWGAPAPADAMPEADLDAIMLIGTDGRRVLWLVLSEPAMWDPRGLVKAWLDEHAVAPPEERVFAHVSVYRYVVRNE